MSFLLWKALHLIFVVTWFSGLFYLPRLFVYHAMATEEVGRRRFCTMERKLYYGITWPSGILTTFSGLMMLSTMSSYLHFHWLQLKLVLVALLWVFHLVCGHYLKAFAKEQNTKSHVFFRVFNELPVLVLVGAILLAILQPKF